MILCKTLIGIEVILQSSVTLHSVKETPFLDNKLQNESIEPIPGYKLNLFVI
jgi:hypothetical protein